MRTTFAASLFLALLLAACAGTNTPTPDTTAALEARVAALEAQLAAQPAEPEAHDEAGARETFGVAVAQYVMDTAGFHGMDEALNETQTVEPAYLTSVTRVRKVVAAAPWPEALHEQSGALVTVLEELAAALEADNAADAAALAAEAHTVQHDLSHAIDNWLGEGHGHGD